MKKVIMFSLLLAVTSNVLAIPTITKSVSTGITFKFIETLSEKLPSGYKVKIDLNNGKGLVAMTCSGTTCTLSSNALPKVDSTTYKVGIYDAKGLLQGETIDGSYVITSTEAINTATAEVNTTTKTFSYTKISNLGAVLPDTANLGSRASDWACTKDNKTGLIWEVKTDGGLRDWMKTYTNYFAGGSGYGDIENADVFVKSVNKQNLCGSKTWRLPTKSEMESLVFCSDNKNQTLSKEKFGANCTGSPIIPTINTTYFPNTYEGFYWSSSQNADDNRFVWSIHFSDSYSSSSIKFEYNAVRLVR